MNKRNVCDIDVAGLTYSYNGEKVLDDVSFKVQPRDFIGIIGPNGGGKTTLIKLLLGLLEPHSGEIAVYGGRPEKSVRRMGYVPQHTMFNGKFPVSVLDVTLMGRLKKFKLKYNRADRTAAENALNKVYMLERKNDRFDELSVGQQQRVLIARALTTGPGILILDEPTASIDPTGQTALFEILQELNKELTILLVSHDLSVVLNYVNKVACVNMNLWFHDAPHVTTEMLQKTFGFSIDQICPLEDLPIDRPTETGHEHGGAPGV